SRLVYGVGTGFGLKGPEADFPSFENTLYAKSGLMTSAGEPGQPTEIPPGIGDRIGAVSLAYAVLAALLHRERSGKGQLVTSSIFGGLVSHMTPLFMMGLLTGQEVTRMKSGKANPMFTTHRCKGDTWVNLHCFPEASLWPAFCKVLDVAYLENDPRFATVQERAKRWEELHSIVDPVFLTRTGEEWEKLFRQDKVPTSVVNQCSDVFSSPQALANQHIIEYDHPVLGRVKVVGFPIELSETPLTLRLPAPELGQDTEEVLNEICGYSAEEIEKLKDERVI
ncbi:MAG: CoA transferase, partial [Chloroflexi bacterium]|nr:CoA transferase [Chloroflexota bacterium]